MTCKNCIHSRVCFDSEGTTRYYGTDAAANNVEDLCPCFADRSRYVVREKGEWEIREDSYGNELMWCPLCHEEFYDGDNDTVDHTPNFCPNCGADMKGAANDG